MCGRFYIDKKNKKIKKILDDLYSLPGLARAKTGDIGPAEVVAVIAPWGHRTEVRPMVWGLPRNFAQPGGLGNLLINSSLELALSRPVFTSPFLHNPVVIPVTGFYGWNDNDDIQPHYFFCRPDRSVIYLAGVYSLFSEYGPVRERFTLLTTAANREIAPFSNRMPVVLDESELGVWLSGREPGYFIERSSAGIEAQAAA